MLNAVPRVLPAAAIVGVLLAWTLPCDVASAAKPRDFGSGATTRTLHTATSTAAQTNISNSPVCTAQYDQFGPSLIPDGSGNGLAVWSDARSGNLDVYAQKVNASGSAVWILNGAAVCKDLADQTSPRAVPDGVGGMIVVWVDGRSGAAKDIYAQRLDPFGTSLWTSNGVPVCNAAGDQLAPVAVSDGVGGVIVAWTDDRAGAGNSDVYVQRLNSAGAAQWPSNGVALCSAAGTQRDLSIATDSNQGAYVAWQDQRVDVAGDIYARRVTSAGAPQGLADGTPLCTASGAQETPVLVADGAGGVIAGWVDHRGGSYDIYAQRMNSAIQWALDGVAVCGATGDQSSLKAATDGAAGAYFAWQDGRGADADVYVQRMSPAGAPMWTADGVAVCAAAADQVAPTIQRDPAGGALVAWTDNRSATSAADVYAQRIDGAGAVQWTADGVQLCDAPNAQDSATLMPDGVGGAVIAWHDMRGQYADIYGQPVDASGVVGNQCVAPTALSESVPQTLTATQNYRTFNNLYGCCPVYFWCGVAVRGAPGSDWDIEGYDSGTWGQAPYPSCFGSSLAGSFGSGSVDMVIYDENEGHTPPGIYGVRPFRYSGTGSATVEFDGGPSEMVVCTNADPNHPVASPLDWTGVVDIYDVSMTAGINYTFDLVRTPADADIKLLFFSSVGSPDYYYVAPRSSRVFETNSRYYSYTPPATAFYGVVLVNETGAPASYVLKVWSDTPTVGVGKLPALTTRIESVAPNPAHGRAAIKFSLREASDVSFDVLDMAGRVVSRLPSQHWEPGVWSIDWDGRADGATPLSTGIYFVQMQVNGRRMGLGRVALIQ